MGCVRNRPKRQLLIENRWKPNFLTVSPSLPCCKCHVWISLCEIIWPTFFKSVTYKERKEVRGERKGEEKHIKTLQLIQLFYLKGKESLGEHRGDRKGSGDETKVGLWSPQCEIRWITRPYYVKTVPNPSLNKMLCYRKDDHAMRPMYECSDNFLEFLTTPTARLIFPKF